MDDLSVNELRALVRQRREAVTRKIARTRRSNGADLAGTQYDPRRDNQTVKRYNRRQLLATLQSYDKFVARSTQFVGDADRRPITKRDWNEYVKAERALNAASEQRRKPFDNVELPGKNQTFKAHREATRPGFSVSADPAVNDPYPTYNRKPSDTVAGKLAKLTKSLKVRAKPSSYMKTLREARKSLDLMFGVTQDNELKKAIDKLSMKQFEYLWNVSDFAKAKSTWYHLSKRAQEGHQRDWLDDVGETMADEAKQYVDEAKQIK